VGCSRLGWRTGSPLRGKTLWQYLLQRDAGGFYRLAPQRDLFRDECGKLRRTRVGGGLAAGLLDVLDEAWILYRAAKLRRHPLDDVLGRAGRRHQAGPRDHMETGKALLGERRHVGRLA